MSKYGVATARAMRSHCNANLTVILGLSCLGRRGLARAVTGHLILSSTPDGHCSFTTSTALPGPAKPAGSLTAIEAAHASDPSPLSKSTSRWNETFETCSNAAAQRDAYHERKFQADTMVGSRQDAGPFSRRKPLRSTRGVLQRSILRVAPLVPPSYHRLHIHGPQFGRMNAQ